MQITNTFPRRSGRAVRRSAIVLLAAATAFLTVTGAGAGAQESFASEVIPAAPAGKTIGTTFGWFVLQGKPPRRQVESELITITPAGFEPAVLTRPKGPFFLFVDNRSGLNSVSLRLDRVAGNRLHEVHVPREQLDWAEIFDLNPGEYVLSEADHPAWSCKITITPN